MSSPIRRPRLTVRKIRAWADAHFKRTGRYPTVWSGAVPESPEWDWSMIDGCLEFGGSGLPGGSSLVLLLAEHRGFVGGGPRKRLSIKLILTWADRHQIRTGKWPDVQSGPVKGVRGFTWRDINAALRDGGMGLPGGSSLRAVVTRYRGKSKAGARRGLKRDPLTVKQILKWADQHYAAQRRWPSLLSGDVAGGPGETWKRIDSCLRKGNRGLTGKSSVSKLLVQHRGRKPHAKGTTLTIEQILEWADRHHERTGRWPSQRAGRVHEARRESWGGLTAALANGCRGLPKGTSLAGLLARKRGAAIQGYKKPLTVARILKWADEHKARTGDWPIHVATAVHGAAGETWPAVRSALRRGSRGQPGGITLRQLLFKHRPEARVDQRGRPLLTIANVLHWADAYYAAHQRWPSSRSGAIPGAPGETWNGVDKCLRFGRRGLPGHSSLSKLLRKRRSRKAQVDPRGRPFLSVAKILSWADEYYAAHRRWPSARSGDVPGAPGESWKSIDTSLLNGGRGLPGNSSLSKLLQKHRGSKPRAKGTTLTVEQILEWADRHYERTGRWPSTTAGRVHEAPGENWSALDAALAQGSRGLPKGNTLRRLLADRLPPRVLRKPPPTPAARPKGRTHGARVAI